MSQSYWTAASETHQRESNISIIQLNNRSVKDRSFSRKIESERSFFVSECHRVRWISGKVYEISFCLKNGLVLTEKEGGSEDAVAYTNRVQGSEWKDSGL